jgi:hypothetical protein
MSGRNVRETVSRNLQLDDLSDAIQENRVSFPLPVLIFARQYGAHTLGYLQQVPPEVKRPDVVSAAGFARSIGEDLRSRAPHCRLPDRAAETGVAA